jgi:hypothetical protein
MCFQSQVLELFIEDDPLWRYTLYTFNSEKVMVILPRWHGRERVVVYREGGSGSKGDTGTTVGGSGSEGDIGTTVGGSGSEGDTGTTVGGAVVKETQVLQ